MNNQNPQAAPRTLHSLQLRAARQLARGRPFDWSPDSYDMRRAMARAVRLYFRLHGERVTLAFARNF